MTKNKNFNSKLTGNISKIIPEKILLKNFPKQFFFPFWHTVSDKLPQHVKNLYKIKTENEFIAEINFMLKYFEPADFSDFVYKKQTSKKPKFIPSFDDGMSQCAEFIAPELLKKGINAIFFINPDFVDNKNLFFKHKISIIAEMFFKGKVSENQFKEISNICKSKFNITELLKSKTEKPKIIEQIAQILEINFDEYLKTLKPYMSKTQINSLAEKGFYIGAHSVNHPLFSEINKNEQLLQITESVDFVMKNFNQKFKLFAFPFTDFGVENSIFDKIYAENICDFTFATAGIKNDIYKKNIQRTAIEKNGQTAQKILKNQITAYFIKSLLNKNVAKRK